MNTEKKEETIVPQKHRLRTFLVFLFIIIILLFCHMRYLTHQTLKVKEYAIINESLPSSFNGFKIVHLSDIHFGITTNETEIENIVQKVNELKPNIIVFTGDLFDSSITLSDKNIDFLKDQLSRLNASYKKYAIKGDNDYLDEELYQNILTTSNFHLLENQNELIYQNGLIPIKICGISSLQKSTYDLNKTLKTEITDDLFTILLSHEPTILNEVEEESVDLILAGHSLGGLIKLPYFGGILKKEATNEYQEGSYQKGKTELFVSSGIGTEKYNFRLLNPPSINFYRLYNYK